jgi:hypothetical protein
MATEGKGTFLNMQISIYSCWSPLFSLSAARLIRNMVLNQVELEYFIGTKVARFVVIFPMTLVLSQSD